MTQRQLIGDKKSYWKLSRVKLPGIVRETQRSSLDSYQPSMNYESWVSNTCSIFRGSEETGRDSVFLLFLLRSLTFQREMMITLFTEEETDDKGKANNHEIYSNSKEEQKLVLVEGRTRMNRKLSLKFIAENQ